MSTAKKIAKRDSKPKTTKSVTKLSGATMTREQGYGSHKEGSRKSKVHQLFDKEGPEAGWILGLKLQLKASTLRSWFAAWKRLQSKSKTRSRPTQVRHRLSDRMDFPQLVKPRTRK
jgi:hypothetical protein